MQIFPTKFPHTLTSSTRQALGEGIEQAIEMRGFELQSFERGKLKIDEAKAKPPFRFIKLLERFVD